MKRLSLFGSYNYIKATQSIPKWDASCNPDYSATASDLGQEVDFRATYKIYDQLGWTLRGGYFMPGKAARYLINGTSAYKDAAW
ncbi:hypothetical protein DRI50_07790 [candidate division KSB1 bacterium]|nr:MAG: hypothetical protein DRI50_07790 [candidate division KSB1 bacterium]